jgi:hypothetical protein
MQVRFIGTAAVRRAKPCSVVGCARLVLGGLLLAGAARADSYTGAGWVVRFNLPDQVATVNSVRPDEYVIRNAFLARLDALASNDWACLATYTFSGNSESAGAAGPVLLAISNALVRGARLGFVADNGVNVASNYWPGISLTGLSLRAGNALQLARAPADSGIMHDKVGVFWYRAATQAWVLTGSWNFTGGASSYQWNILAEIQDNSLGAAYSNEMREMLSGRFHASTNKSHAHDGTRFRLPGTTRDGWVRFAPYPDRTYGGTNALTDIVAAIDAATNEIYFALNKLTRPDVAHALIRACNRGVTVHGTIPESDRSTTNGDSYFMVQMLAAPSNYASANRVLWYEAYTTPWRKDYDGGESDLTHTKYMVIDPHGTNPLVIHGSANWTDAALVDDNMNDENILFLPHPGMAQAFVGQFSAMTDGLLPRCVISSRGSPQTSSVWFWLPDAISYELVRTTNLLNGTTWTHRVQLLPAGRGTNTLTVTNSAPRSFFRIRRVP